MPGNEESVISFLVQSLQNEKPLNLPIIGFLKEVSMPIKEDKKIVRNTSDLKNFSSNDRYKKADVYINNIGISIKEHCSPLYNKIQRKHIPNLIKYLFPDRKDLEDILNNTIDTKIERVNQGSNRDIHWSRIFSKKDFFIILEFLMMRGYADTKLSSHPADYILISPKHLTHENIKDIKILSFENFFEEYKNNIVIAARRIWIGQNSRSENRRALGINKQEDNKRWVFKNISGKPTSSWNTSFPSEDRREVFYLNINTVK